MADTTIKKDLGVFVRGLVMNNNEFKVNGELRRTVDLAITGCKEMISVPVEKELPLQTVHAASVVPSMYKGKLYWNLVEPA